ncbi:MAG: hypothetical protein ACREIV_08380, partial [Planctomycetaceae bacterium]
MNAPANRTRKGAGIMALRIVGHLKITNRPSYTCPVLKRQPQKWGETRQNPLELGSVSVTIGDF